MDRRKALGAIAGVTGVAALSALSKRGNAAPDSHEIPGAKAFRIGQTVDINATSNPLQVGDRKIYIVSVGRATLQFDEQSRLTAKLITGVYQQAQIDYWISAAVFDAKGVLLGAASHKESVSRVRLGRTPIISREISLDFGISKAFQHAALIAVSVSERDVPPSD